MSESAVPPYHDAMQTMLLGYELSRSMWQWSVMDPRIDTLQVIEGICKQCIRNHRVWISVMLLDDLHQRLPRHTVTGQTAKEMC